MSIVWLQVSMRTIASPFTRIVWVSVRGLSSHHQELTAVDAVCPLHDEFATARPYSEVPGPQPLPFIGNTWRLLPIVGMYWVP